MITRHGGKASTVDNEIAADSEDAEPTFESFFGKQRDEHPEFPDTDYFLGGGGGGRSGGDERGQREMDGFPDMKDLEDENPDDYQETNPADYGDERTEDPPADEQQPEEPAGIRIVFHFSALS